jgi:hypothetical protein
MFLFAFRRPVRQPRHSVDETLRARPSRDRSGRHRRPSPDRAEFQQLRTSARPRGGPEAELDVGRQNVLPPPLRSPRLHRVRHHRRHHLPEAARKLEEKILLKQQNIRS